ncbi:MAG: hypothetical protein AABX51_02290 [Nanoarchaeota archaeon]
MAKIKKAMSTYVVKKIDVLSTAKLYGVMMGLIGLVIGIIWALLALLAATVLGTAVRQPGLGASIGGLLGLAMIIFFPLVYGGIGFVAGALGAIGYNFISGFVGGIELELEQK